MKNYLPIRSDSSKTLWAYILWPSSELIGQYLVSLIMGQIKVEHLELFALEFGKIAESDFVYTLVSINTNQLAPNLGKMYLTIRSPMSLIMDLIGPELSRVICP